MFVPILENGWGNEYEEHQKLRNKKCPDLRLQPNRASYGAHRWTESANVRLIFIGDTAQQLETSKQDEAATRKANETKRNEQYQLDHSRRAASEKFLKDHQVPAMFAPAFSTMTNVAAMCALLRREMPKDGGKRANLLHDLRVQLADTAMEHISPWKLKSKGPVALAKYYKKLAATWGVELPADLVELAKKYEPVSTKTGQGGKKNNGGGE